VETQARDFTSAFDFVVRELSKKYESRVNQEMLLETFQAVQESRISELQQWISEEAGNLVSQGFLGASHLILLTMPSQWLPRAITFAADDPSLIYRWEVTDWLVEAVEEGKPFVLREEGLAELGLSGEQLLAFSPVTQTLMIAGSPQSIRFAYLGVIPMGATIGEARSFFSEEKKHSLILLVSVLVATLLAVVLIVFLVLSYLIRKRITRPVEQLSAAAARVSEGDLDVSVEIHPGSDFEVLERTFRDMVESFRRYIAVSVESGEG
jgi:HAMP domain-containing protein